MKKKIFKILFVFLYLFASSTLLHVGVMAHDVSTNIEVPSLESMPCHEKWSDSVQKKNSKKDCFEACMGVYDDIGGLVNIEIKDSIIGWVTIFTVFSVSTHNTKQYLFIQYDPPSLACLGYARVGKEIKKIE